MVLPGYRKSGNTIAIDPLSVKAGGAVIAPDLTEYATDAEVAALTTSLRDRVATLEAKPTTKFVQDTAEALNESIVDRSIAPGVFTAAVNFLRDPVTNTLREDVEKKIPAHGTGDVLPFSSRPYVLIASIIWDSAHYLLPAAPAEATDENFGKFVWVQNIGGYSIEMRLENQANSINRGGDITNTITVPGRSSAYFYAETNGYYAYLVVDADLSGYAQSTDIPDVSSFITAADLPDLTGYVQTTTLADYTKTVDLPVIPDVSNFVTIAQIPDVSGLATTAELATLANRVTVVEGLTAAEVDLSGLATTAALTALTNRVVVVEGHNHPPPDLSEYVKTADLPVIPDVSGFITAADLPDLSGYALTTAIPEVSGFAMTTQLANYSLITHTHSEYATAVDLPPQLDDAWRNPVHASNGDPGIVSFRQLDAWVLTKNFAYANQLVAETNAIDQTVSALTSRVTALESAPGGGGGSLTTLTGSFMSDEKTLNQTLAPNADETVNLIWDLTQIDQLELIFTHGNYDTQPIFVGCGDATFRSVSVWTASSGGFTYGVKDISSSSPATGVISIRSTINTILYKARIWKRRQIQVQLAT